jgi:hypothetical protein
MEVFKAVLQLGVISVAAAAVACSPLTINLSDSANNKRANKCASSGERARPAREASEKQREQDARRPSKET